MSDEIANSVLEAIHELPIIQKLLTSDSEHDARLYAQVPTAYVSQFLTCMHALEIINQKLPPLESYKKAIHNFGLGAPGSEMREVYSSVVIRLWIILNKLVDPLYELPSEVINPIINKTLSMIKEKEYNYFIEPLLLPSELLEHIIKYSNNKLLKIKMEWYLQSNFLDNSINMLNMWDKWLGSSIMPSAFDNIYMIQSYLLMLKSTPTVLKSSLVLDLDIRKKLDASLFQSTLTAKQTANENEKIKLQDQIKKLDTLTNNMSSVLTKFFPKSGGTKKKQAKTQRRYIKKANKKTKKAKTKKTKIKKAKTKKIKN